MLNEHNQIPVKQVKEKSAFKDNCFNFIKLLYILRTGYQDLHEKKFDSLQLKMEVAMEELVAYIDPENKIVMQTLSLINIELEDYQLNKFL